MAADVRPRPAPRGRRGAAGGAGARPRGHPAGAGRRLLHDVGKIEAGLGTYGRVVATLSAKVAGAEMATTWRSQRGFARRVGLYLQHDELGGDLLELAGSDPLTVAWTREHHLPRVDDWTVDRRRRPRALKAADDD